MNSAQPNPTDDEMQYICINCTHNQSWHTGNKTECSTNKCACTTFDSGLSQPNPNDELRQKIANELGIAPRVRKMNHIMQALHAHMKAMLQDVIGEELSLVEYRPGFVAKPDVETAIQIEGKNRHNELLAEQWKRSAKWLPKEEQE